MEIPQNGSFSDPQIGPHFWPILGHILDPSWNPLNVEYQDIHSRIPLKTPSGSSRIWPHSRPIFRPQKGSYSLIGFPIRRAPEGFFNRAKLFRPRPIARTLKNRIFLIGSGSNWSILIIWLYSRLMDQGLVPMRSGASRNGSNLGYPLCWRSFKDFRIWPILEILTPKSQIWSIWDLRRPKIPDFHPFWTILGVFWPLWRPILVPFAHFLGPPNMPSARRNWISGGPEVLKLGQI